MNETQLKGDEIPRNVRAPRGLVAVGLIELGSSFVGVGWRAKLHGTSPTDITKYDRRDVREALTVIPSRYRRWVLDWLRYGARERRMELERKSR